MYVVGKGGGSWGWTLQIKKFGFPKGLEVGLWEKGARGGKKGRGRAGGGPEAILIPVENKFINKSNTCM